jgi:hypothetical protein
MANKYKNKQGKFISREQFIKENINDLSPENLNAKELIEYQKIVQQEAKEQARLEKNAKISEAAKKRVRDKGKFLNKEQERRARYQMKKFDNLEFNQKNFDTIQGKTLGYTVNNMKMIDTIEEHKGNLFINGNPVTKQEAQFMFTQEHELNLEEWSQRLEKEKEEIYLIIYDLEYNALTLDLNIITTVTDPARVIISPPKNAKKTKK